jgi:glutathionyl-hydroquinone reductase
MASLIDGKWSDEPVATLTKNGEFNRKQSVFRTQISDSEVAPGRFHLYVSYACPWAHRTLIVRSLKRLDNIIPVSVTNAFMGEKGWSFGSGHELEYLAEVYRGADPRYTGKITVPVLWDNRHETIANNESSEIIRIFNSSFNKFTDSTIDLYPEHLRIRIDDLNDRIYENVNNGVYKAGFANNQKAYDQAFNNLFKTLDEMEDILSKSPFLTGDYITEADIRFFTTLIRFDCVYYVHFKCNKKLIAQYSNLSNYTKCLYQIPEIKATCHFDHIKEHYYLSHRWLNKSGIIPGGPALDFDSLHNRGKAQFFLQRRAEN